MHHFRERWLAVFGGILLLSLSVSTVFGARPEGADATRGQSVSAFAHSLVFGGTTDDESENQTEDETETDTDDDVDTTDDTADESQDEDASDDQSETETEEDTADASNHGACVSEVARDKEAIGGVNMNHGGAVSEAARVTCAADESSDEEPTDTDESTDTDATETSDETDADTADADTSDKKDKADKPSHGNSPNKVDRAKGGKSSGHGHGKGHR